MVMVMLFRNPEGTEFILLITIVDRTIDESEVLRNKL